MQDFLRLNKRINYFLAVAFLAAGFLVLATTATSVPIAFTFLANADFKLAALFL